MMWQTPEALKGLLDGKPKTYRVRAIKADRNNGTEYQVQWVGFPGQDTWEPVEELQSTAAEALRNYLARKVKEEKKIAKQPDGSKGELADDTEPTVSKCSRTRSGTRSATQKTTQDKPKKPKKRSTIAATQPINHGKPWLDEHLMLVFEAGKSCPEGTGQVHFMAVARQLKRKVSSSRWKKCFCLWCSSSKVSSQFFFCVLVAGHPSSRRYHK
jgi:hypothetical protein